MLHKYIENFSNINMPCEETCVNIVALPEFDKTIKFIKPFLNFPIEEELHGTLTVDNDGFGVFESMNGKDTFFTIFAGEAPKKIDTSKIEFEEDECAGRYYVRVKGAKNYFIDTAISLNSGFLTDRCYFKKALVLAHPELF